MKLMQEAFQRIKIKGLISNSDINYKMHLVFQKLRNKELSKLIDRY